MKFLKMVMLIELEMVEAVPDESPVGSMLEEALADKAGLEEMEANWRAQFAGKANVVDYTIKAIDVVEV